MDELDAVLSQFNLENAGEDNVDESGEGSSALKLEEMLQNLGLIVCISLFFPKLPFSFLFFSFLFFSLFSSFVFRRRIPPSPPF